MINVKFENFKLLSGNSSIFNKPNAFNNFSNDIEYEFFADGLSEDLTTLLSAYREFPVIARNSAFRFKGKEFDEERRAVKEYRKEAAKQGFGTFGDLLRAKLEKDG